MLTIMSTQKIFSTAELGAAIKQVRRRRRLTQSELAEHANVSRGVVQKLEKGRGTIVLDHALQILHTLSFDLAIQPRGPSQESPSRD